MNMFNKVAIKKPYRFKFDMSHNKMFTCFMAQMIPIFVKETLPGDQWTNTSEIMVRFAPMLAPIMDRVQVKIDTFFVPDRIIWDESEEFHTGGEDGTDAPVLPYITLAEANKAITEPGQLCDFMGVPDLSAVAFGADTIRLNALRFRAILQIYNDYYRNQNVLDPIEFSTASGAVSGADIIELTTMRKCMWEKDRFTSALPDTQRGDEVLIPMEGDASISYLPTSKLKTPGGGNSPDNDLRNAIVGADSLLLSNAQQVRVENLDEVTFANATITINDLRRAERLQEFLEKSNVAGGRYKEYLKAHWNVNSSDGRLQRAEYIGGSRQNVVVSAVFSTATSEDVGTPPQGNMSGAGIAIGKGKRIRFRAPEHGHIISIMRILPRTSYVHGIEKGLQRVDRYDFAIPEFAQIGEQPLMTREIYATPGNAKPTDNTVFGYQSQYSEYKYSPSTVHGEFKTNLDYWTMFRRFSGAPILNQSFVEADPTTRIFAVEDLPQMYCHVHHSASAIRALPYFGTPTL